VTPHLSNHGYGPRRGGTEGDAEQAGLLESDLGAVGAITPRGPLVEKIFGWSFLFTVFVMVRFLAVSWPRDIAPDAGFGEALQTAIETSQHVLTHASITDLPAIIGATLASEPLLTLLLCTTVSLSLCMYSFPGIIFEDDYVGGRAMLMLMVGIVSALVAVIIAPWPWKVVLLAGLAVVGWAMASWWGRGSAVARWNRFADALLDRRGFRARPVDWTTRASLEEGGEPLTFREMATLLAERSKYARDELERRKDEAFGDPQVVDAYLEAMTLRRFLALELRARRRGQVLDPLRVKRSFRVQDLVAKVRHFVLARGLVLAGMMVVISLAVTPTSWIAPTCLTEDERSETVYILSSSPPTVLVDATRSVETRTSWDHIDLAAGECGDDAT